MILGHPVLLLTVTEQKYEVIAVGITKALTPGTSAQIPDDKTVIFIHHVEECASSYLKVGQLVAWPKCLLLNGQTSTSNVNARTDVKVTKEQNYKTGIYWQIPNIHC